MAQYTHSLSSRDKLPRKQLLSTELTSLQENSSNVTVNGKVLRTLLLYARETRLRLSDVETKLSEMQRSMETLQKNRDEQLLAIVRYIQSLGNHPNFGNISGTEKVTELTTPHNIVTAENKATGSFGKANSNAYHKKEKEKPNSVIGRPLPSRPNVIDIFANVATLSNPNSVPLSNQITNDKEIEQHNQNSDTATSVHPLYAVVKKKPRPLRYSGSRFSLHADGVASSERPKSTLCFSLPRKDTDQNSSYGDELANVPSQSVVSNTTWYCASPESKIEPLTSTSSCENQLDSKHMRESNKEESTLTENNFMAKTKNNSQISPKAGGRKLDADHKRGVLFSKFKQKLKDTKHKVNRHSSKESLLCDTSDGNGGSINEAVTQNSEDHATKMAVLPTEMKVLQPKSCISYTSARKLSYEYKPRNEDDNRRNDDFLRLPHMLDGSNELQLSTTKFSNGYVTTSSTGSNWNGTVNLESSCAGNTSENLADPGYASIGKSNSESGVYESVTFSENSDKVEPMCSFPPKTSNNTKPKFSSSSTSESHRSSLSSLFSSDKDEDFTVPIDVEEIFRKAEARLLEKGKFNDGTVPGISVKEMKRVFENDATLSNNGLILNDVTHQQGDMRLFESEIQDDPPPKPSRPGFPSKTSGYPPQTSPPIYQTTTMQHGMYPGNNNLPVVPPKTGLKLMNPEELANHEAQLKLLQREIEDASLEEKLALQREQAEEDDKWIKQEEQLMHNPDASPTNGEFEDPEHLYQSADEVRRMRAAGGSRTGMTAPPPPSMPPAKPPRTLSTREPPITPPPKSTFEEVKPTPTMKLDRENDAVYKDTMNVVRSVLLANQEAMEAKPDDIFVLVKNIGKALKALCTSLEQEMLTLPEEFHREIDMAQKTTNKDLSQIINQMKLVKKFFATTQVTAYKKCLMAATQVLAMDAKNLLDVVDNARTHRPRTDASPETSQLARDELPEPTESELPRPSTSTSSEES